MSSKEDEQLPEILRDLRAGEDGYTPPSEMYFSELAERSLRVAKAPAVVRSTSRWMAVAAGVLVLLFAGWWAFPTAAGTELAGGQTQNRSSDELLADIEPEVINAYVTEQIDEFTLELYAEAPLQE